VAAGGQELAALDLLLSERATAQLAREPLPSAAPAPGRPFELHRAAVLGLAAGAALSLHAEGAGRAADAPDGAARFGRALDLVRLLDDGSSVSVATSGNLEAGVLALVLRALDGGADAPSLAAEL